MVNRAPGVEPGRWPGICLHAGVLLAPNGETVAKILIVEDSPDNMKLFRTLLTLRGHEVTGLPGGDGLLETMLDANRIKATGCAVVQMNTGAGCHLDADGGPR